MQAANEVLYFPYRNQLGTGSGSVTNPIDGSSIPLDGAASELLMLCDGYRTREEITIELMKRHECGRTAATSRAAPVLDELSRAGMLWARQERIREEKYPPPSFVQWDITSRCNNACRHCVVSAGEAEARDIPPEGCCRIVDELVDYGVTEAVISGGEPLIRPDFFQIAEYAAGRGMDLVVATNGTLITEEKARRMSELGIGAHVSLDGATAAVHDAFRGAAGAWEKAIGGIRNLASAEVPFIIAATVTAINFKEIPELYEMAGELGAHTFRILPFVPYGRGSLSRELEVSPAKMRDLTRFLWDAREKGGLPVAAMEFECVFEPPASEYVDPQTRIGCDGAVSYCTITSTGEVLPCNFFRGADADNVMSRPFSWIWENSRFLHYFRSINVSDLKGACGKCDWLPACRGSCIAANFAHGDIFQANRHCWIAHPAP